MKQIKTNKKKSKYLKRLPLVFTLYTLFIALCFGSVWVTMLTVPYENSSTAAVIAFVCAFVLFLCGSAALLFWIVPALKRSQAREDFLKHDFTPYISSNEREIFGHSYLVCRYVFTPSPFDGDESVTLHGEDGLTAYFGQFTPDRFIRAEHTENDPNDSPFFIRYFSDDQYKDGNGITVRVEKKVSGDEETVDIFDVHDAEFTQDGLQVGEKLYPYEDVTAEVRTGFGKDTAFTVSLRLLILLADEGFLSFTLSPRIAAVCERFGIKINNRELLDYVIKDPLRAYEQAALQLGIKKLK